MTIFLAAFLLVATSACHSGSRQICEALDKLSGQGTETAVVNEVTQLLAESGSVNRASLTKELNSRLMDMSDRPVWWSEARMAGHFRLAGTAEVLAASLEFDMRSSSLTGLYRRASLEDDPAALALVDIGEPAEPAVIKELSKGSLMAQSRSLYILRHIGGARAEEALRQQYEVEMDPEIKGRIAQELHLMSKQSP